MSVRKQETSSSGSRVEEPGAGEKGSLEKSCAAGDGNRQQRGEEQGPELGTVP